MQQPGNIGIERVGEGRKVFKHLNQNDILGNAGIYKEIGGCFQASVDILLTNAIN